jgi:hypothetical protein
MTMVDVLPVGYTLFSAPQVTSVGDDGLDGAATDSLLLDGGAGLPRLLYAVSSATSKIVTRTATSFAPICKFIK